MAIKKYISIFSFLAVVILLVGCAQPAQVSFSIHNGSSSKIFIHYYPFATNDTQVVQLGPDTLITLLDVENTSGSSNWFYDYKMHINGIYNLVGDSILFNPNISQYWYLYVGEPNYQYKLSIEDSDF